MPQPSTKTLEQVTRRLLQQTWNEQTNIETKTETVQTPKPNEQNQKRKTNLTADTYTELFFVKLTMLQLNRRPWTAMQLLQLPFLLIILPVFNKQFYSPIQLE